jgi:hypothetical protein
MPCFTEMVGTDQIPALLDCASPFWNDSTNFMLGQSNELDFDADRFGLVFEDLWQRWDTDWSQHMES